MNSLLRKKDLSSPMSEFLSTIVLVVVMWFGAISIKWRKSLNAQEFIGYILIFSQIIPPVPNHCILSYPKGSAKQLRQRVYEIKDLKESITNILKPKSITKINDSIKFNNVNFHMKY